MSSIQFVDGETVIPASWANDVNAATYHGGAVYTPSGSSAVATTVQAKLREQVSVADFGAKADGSTDCVSAVAMMRARHGFVRFTAGAYLLTTTTIDVPVIFEMGAYLTVPSNSAVTIHGTIESPRQWIFRGDGSYVLGGELTTGEVARQVHASWFGAFPGPAKDGDAAVFINKAFAAMGNERECVVDFDVGSYQIFSAIEVSRAGWVRGAGSRRTVFKLNTDDFSVFTTKNEGCRFTGIQFENLTSAFKTRKHPLISLLHPNCIVEDVMVGRAVTSIEVKSGGCFLNNIWSMFDESPPDSCVIAVGASNTTIQNVFAHPSAAYGPTVLVHIGKGLGPGITGVANVQVHNVNSCGPAIPVMVEASEASVSRCLLRDIRHTNAAIRNPLPPYETILAPGPSSMVSLVTRSSRYLEDVIIDGVQAASQAANGIRIEQSSTAYTSGVSINNVTLAGSAGTGIEFVQAAGALMDITVGANVNVSKRTTPYSYKGTTGGIKIAPEAMANVRPAYCYDFEVGIEAKVEIKLGRPVDTGFMMVSAGSSNYGIYVISASVTPSIMVVNQSSAMATATSPSFIGGKIVVGVDNGLIYLVNATDLPQRCSISLLAGGT